MLLPSAESARARSVSPYLLAGGTLRPSLTGAIDQHTGHSYQNHSEHHDETDRKYERHQKAFPMNGSMRPK